MIQVMLYEIYGSDERETSENTYALQSNAYMCLIWRDRVLNHAYSALR